MDSIVDILHSKRENIHKQPRDVTFDEMQRALDRGKVMTQCPHGCEVKPGNKCDHGYEGLS